MCVLVGRMPGSRWGAWCSVQYQTILDERHLWSGMKRSFASMDKLEECCSCSCGYTTWCNASQGRRWPAWGGWDGDGSSTNAEAAISAQSGCACSGDGASPGWETSTPARRHQRKPGGNVLAVEMKSIQEVEISMQEEMWDWRNGRFPFSNLRGICSTPALALGSRSDVCLMRNVKLRDRVQSIHSIRFYSKKLEDDLTHKISTLSLLLLHCDGEEAQFSFGLVAQHIALPWDWERPCTMTLCQISTPSLSTRLSLW